MHAKPVYETKRFQYEEEFLDLEKSLNKVDPRMKVEKKVATQNRFKGYMYKGGVYLDNPGVQASVDKETRALWRSRGWIT